MIKRFMIPILVSMIILTGCSSNPASKISQETKNTIEKVSEIYGVKNPKIVDIRKTEEETSKKPMYIISLEGNFQKGNQSSKTLTFSMLKDGSEIWALAFDSWVDHEVDMTKLK